METAVVSQLQVKSQCQLSDCAGNVRLAVSVLAHERNPIVQYVRYHTFTTGSANINMAPGPLATILWATGSRRVA